MPERIRNLAEPFLKLRARESYRYRTGQARRPDLGALYGEAGELFQEASITRIQRRLAGATGEEEQGYRFILEFLVNGRVAKTAAEDLEQRLIWVANASVEAESVGRIAVRTVPQALATTPSADQRRMIDRAWHDGLEDLEPIFQKTVDREHDVVRELGYGDYVEARELLTGIDLRGMARAAEAFLADTEDLYDDLMGRYLVPLAGVDPLDATRGDMYRVRWGEPYRHIFPGKGMVDTISNGLRGCGIDLEAGGRLRVETEGGFSQSQRTFWQPMDVPNRVVVVAGANEGWLGYARFLRSLGEGLHAAHTSPDLPLEFRWMGDWSVSFGFGLTLRHLVSTPEWLEEHHGLSGDDLRDYLVFAGYMELMTLRAWAGRLIYELELHSGGDVGGKAPLFAERMSEATGFRHDRRGYLWNVEAGVAVARKLRGAAFGALVVEYLVDRYGPAWFRDREAGFALLEMLSSGRRFTAPQLAMQIAAKPLRLDRLRERIEAQIG